MLNMSTGQISCAKQKTLTAVVKRYDHHFILEANFENFRGR